MANSFAYPEPYQNVGTGGDIFSRTGGNVGGWPSKAAACDPIKGLAQNQRLGTVISVMESGKPVEYWWPGPGVLDTDLVPYGGNPGGWPSKAAACDPLTGLAPDQRLGTVIAVMENGVPREYWWPGPGTADEDLVPYGGVNVRPYANNTFYKAGTIIYHYRFSFGVDTDFTTLGSLPASWEEARYLGVGFLVSRVPFQAGSYTQNPDTNVITPVTWDLENNYAIQEVSLVSGAFDLTLNVRQDRNFNYMPFTLRIRIKAGARLKSISFPTANGFAGPMPSVVDKVYTTETVLEYEFFSNNNSGNTGTLWYYVPIQQSAAEFVDTDFEFFQANTAYGAKKIVSDQYVTLGFVGEITTGAGFAETWNAAGSGAIVFMGRLPLQSSGFGNSSLPAGTVQAVPVFMYNDSDVVEVVLNNAGVFDLTFTPRPAYSYKGFPVTIRLDLPAGGRLRSYNFTDPVFIGAVPAAPDVAYGVDTVVDLNFVVELVDGAVRWRYVPIASGGTDTNAYLKALPGYGDISKPYLKQDAQGFFYWGAGENAPVNTAPYINNQISAQSGTEGNTIILPLAGTFIDPESNPITYSVTTSNSSIVTAEIDGGNLRLNLNSLGSATITLRATDTGGLFTNMTFTVNVDAVIVTPSNNVFTYTLPFNLS